MSHIRAANSLTIKKQNLQTKKEMNMNENPISLEILLIKRLKEETEMNKQKYIIIIFFSLKSR